MQFYLAGIKDNSDCQFISTVPGEYHDKRKGGDGKDKDLHIITVNYRKNYGATDAFDRLRALYSCHVFTDKYYRSIIFWALDTMVINSFLIAKKKGNRYAQDGLLNYFERLIWNLKEWKDTRGWQKGRKRNRDDEDADGASNTSPNTRQ